VEQVENEEARQEEKESPGKENFKVKDQSHLASSLDRFKLASKPKVR